MQAPRLPDKLSDLLELAVKDCKTAEAAGAEFDMTRWYVISSVSSRCIVCMAGAVMMCTLGHPHQPSSQYEHIDCILPSNYDEDTSNKLVAIDHLRCGKLNAALMVLGILVDPPVVMDLFDEVRDLVVGLKDQDSSDRATWDTYTKVVSRLRDYGL